MGWDMQVTWGTPSWGWRSWGSWQCPGRSCPTAWPCPHLINEHMSSAPAPALGTASQSWASQVPFSVSLAANYSFPVRQSVPNLASQGLLKEIMQWCPLRGSLRNSILRDKRKLMQCNIYQPLSLPMPEGLTINTWSIRRSFSADFLFFFKGIKDDTEVHENNLISMMSPWNISAMCEVLLLLQGSFLHKVEIEVQNNTKSRDPYDTE